MVDPTRETDTVRRTSRALYTNVLFACRIEHTVRLSLCLSLCISLFLSLSLSLSLSVYLTLSHTLQVHV